jgi:hypothetical protein
VHLDETDAGPGQRGAGCRGFRIQAVFPGGLAGVLFGFAVTDGRSASGGCRAFKMNCR